MSITLKPFAVLAVFTLAGCAGTMAPMPPMDAAPTNARSGAPMTTTHNVPVTGRNWKCPGCYK